MAFGAEVLRAELMLQYMPWLLCKAAHRCTCCLGPATTNIDVHIDVYGSLPTVGARAMLQTHGRQLS
jgi:hypothetical protein